nr:MBL fold metallo-hydrolase [Chromobacterium sp. ASV5]
MANITAFSVGHCTHPACMALKGAGFTPRCFPSRAYLIETHDRLLLWDTGYAEHFFDASRHGAYRLYPLVTPVYLDLVRSLREQLRTHGIASGDIHTLLLSHFHADHIAGLRDFPSAGLLASRSGWHAVRGLKGLSAVRQAFLPDLLPPDVETRLAFVEDLPLQPLPKELTPFTHGWDVSGGGEVFVTPLPGHALGHLGAFVLEERGWTLLAADAAWAAESYLELRGPSELSFLVQHNRRDYYSTLGKLHALHHGGRVNILLTHQEEA